MSQSSTGPWQDLRTGARHWASIAQHELWPGPLRPTPQKPLIDSTRCLGMRVIGRGTDGQDQTTRCGNPTINGDFLCYACKDPEGYRTRLSVAMAASRQRTLEAHPVCKHCGRRLSAARVSAGQNTCPTTLGVKCWEMVYTPEWTPEEG